jgi:hypothetical protein
MAIDTSTLEATLQAKFDAVTDPKEMLLLGKAYESTVGGIAVSDIEDAGAAQVATINQVATNTFKTVGGESVLGTGDIATLPDQTGYAGKALVTDGTNASWGDGGTLLSVNSAFDNTRTTFGISTSPTQIPGMSVTVTPKSADSRFIITYNLGHENNHQVGLHLYRNGTRVTAYSTGGWDATHHYGFAAFDYDGNDSSTIGNQSGYTYDHPNTTSAVTYTLRATYGYTSGSYTYHHNRTHGSYAYNVSHMTVWEFIGSDPV